MHLAVVRSAAKLEQQKWLAVDVLTETQEMLESEQCIPLYVLSAEKKLGFHLSLRQIGLYTVETVMPITALGDCIVSSDE